MTIIIYDAVDDDGLVDDDGHNCDDDAVDDGHYYDDDFIYKVKVTVGYKAPIKLHQIPLGKKIRAMKLHRKVRYKAPQSGGL